MWSLLLYQSFSNAVRCNTKHDWCSVNLHLVSICIYLLKNIIERAVSCIVHRCNRANNKHMNDKVGKKKKCLFGVLRVK